MISICAELNVPAMAKQQHIQFTLGQIGAIIVGIAGAFWIVSSVVNQDVRARLLSIDTAITRIELGNKSHGESLARIEEKFKFLDHRVESLEKPHYESKAKAAGFKNPQIVPASLTAQEKFDSKPIQADGGQYLMRYTILGYDSKSEMLAFRVDSIIRSDDGKERLGNVQGNVLTLHAKIGEQVRLAGMFGEFRNAMIFVQVIDRPSPNRAILAIGEKTNPEGKTS